MSSYILEWVAKKADLEHFSSPCITMWSHCERTCTNRTPGSYLLCHLGSFWKADRGQIWQSCHLLLIAVTLCKILAHPASWMGELDWLLALRKTMERVDGDGLIHSDLRLKVFVDFFYPHIPHQKKKARGSLHSATWPRLSAPGISIRQWTSCVICPFWLYIIKVQEKTMSLDTAITFLCHVITEIIKSKFWTHSVDVLIVNDYVFSVQPSPKDTETMHLLLV